MLDNQDTPVTQVNPEEIAGFTVQRSLHSHFLFDIFAIGADGNSLFCAASDLSFEKASAWVDAINAEHYPYVPTPTELVSIELGNQERIFKVAKK